MKTLQQLLHNVAVEQQIGGSNTMVSSIETDSRKVIRGVLFAAVEGTKVDGHQFIAAAIAQGATAILCSKLPQTQQSGVAYLLVSNVQVALGQMLSNFYNNPTHTIKLIGVTGTNGKTTTATLLYRMFKQLGYKVGLLSTVRNFIDETMRPATHTTPDIVQLYALLNEMVVAGCEYCFMEVSSHAIHQNRTAGLTFSGGIFTNITHDHLDYHKTFDEYLRVKKQFFDTLPTSAFALVNADDKNGKIMLQNCQALKQTYSCKSFTDFKCKTIESSYQGTLLEIDGTEVWVHFIGDFNAYNLLGVYAATRLLGQPKEETLRILSTLRPVDGRFEVFRSEKNVTAIVDYAHTPDALVNVLSTINRLRTGNEQLITVVGCGGDRDRTKRPIMAKVSAEASNRLIITADNPRSEDPQAIAEEMRQGVPPTHTARTLTIIDRREAIRTAISLAQPGDVILIAGKGHEDYQEIKGVKHHFDDREVVQQAFNQL